MSSGPTQLLTLTRIGNEYKPRGGDALWLGSKGRYMAGIWLILRVDKRAGGR